MDTIIGRDNEIRQLKAIEASKSAEFIVIYGRRRVGKTFLINQYFKDRFTFKLTGLANKDKDEQLANFGAALRLFGAPSYGDPKNWREAFGTLRMFLEKKRGNAKKIVFIDELPFMDTPRSGLVTALEHFWNDWGCTRDDLILIVCGSATSWITKKIIKNHGGLHNRLTRKIYLNPFNLYECKQYLQYANINFEDKDILECYMILGGIPYYLSLLEKGKSLAQNIDELCFIRKGKLDGEFENLYASLFEKSEDYIRVVEALSTKNMGLTRKEIISCTQLPDGGTLTQILDDLDNCDIIRKYDSFGNKERGALYQLTDFYTFFYFKFIKKHGNSDKGFWGTNINTPIHNAWAGYAFEQLCLYHYPQIEKKLGISGIYTQKSAWRSRQAENGAQIDLVISRADHIINLCEVKYWSSPFTITKAYRQNLDNKVFSFMDETGKRAIHLIMITTFGLKQNEYSGIVQHEVMMEDLFEKA